MELICSKDIAIRSRTKGKVISLCVVVVDVVDKRQESRSQKHAQLVFIPSSFLSSPVLIKIKCLSIRMTLSLAVNLSALSAYEIDFVVVAGFSVEAAFLV